MNETWMKNLTKLVLHFQLKIGPKNRNNVHKKRTTYVLCALKHLHCLPYNSHNNKWRIKRLNRWSIEPTSVKTENVIFWIITFNNEIVWKQPSIKHKYKENSARFHLIYRSIKNIQLVTFYKSWNEIYEIKNFVNFQRQI